MMDNYSNLFRKRNLKQEEFYENKLLEHFRNLKNRNTSGPKKFFSYTLLLFMLLLVIPSIYLTKISLDFRGKAAAEEKTVKVFLYPQNVDSEKNKTFTIFPKLLAHNSKHISSVLISLTFNQNNLKFVNMGEDPKSNMRYLKSTDLNKANSTGKLKVFAGAKNFENAPSAAVALPPIIFQLINDAQSNITLNKDEIEVIFTNYEKASVEIDSTALLTPTSTPTPAIPTPTLTVTPIPTLEPSPTPTPKISFIFNEASPPGSL